MIALWMMMIMVTTRTLRSVHSFTPTTFGRRSRTTTTIGLWQQPVCNEQDPVIVISRRQSMTTAVKAIIMSSSSPVLWGLSSWPVRVAAEEEVVPLDPVAVKAAFDAVRKELLDEGGGVSYLTDKVGAGDFPALLEFTKAYDPVLRKGVMGKAKKMLPTKELKEVATVTANAVTFDLIGINKNSRPGRENRENAAKYVQELKDDVQKFLSLEPTFE